ncbi:hypothetical protein AB9K26_01575 [Psychroserpens sp. XS_ASV72]|uniref:hypothetical protein n=1 Tax=Psychroserpens sp. XS_ASV72 TaxID=3241293 RepID=UPI003517D7D0
MSKIDKKQVIIAGLVGGVVFCLIITVIDYFLGRGFSWQRLGFYYVFSSIMYGFLTYRNFKKHQK